MTRRDAWLWGSLALTLLATAGLATQSEDTVVVHALPAAGAPRAATGSLPLTAQAAWSPLSASALAAWSSPPASGAAAEARSSPAPAVGPAIQDVAPDPSPVAPPLPWRWLGRLDDAEGPRALLDGPGGALLVRESDVVDGQWRLDRIAPDQMRWTWLPGGLPSLQNLPQQKGRS